MASDPVTFKVAVLAPAEGQTGTDMPVGTAVGAAYSSNPPSNIGALTGNSSDGTTASCNSGAPAYPNPAKHFEVNNPNEPITTASTVDGGYYDC